MALKKSYLKYKLEKIKEKRTNKDLNFPARIYQKEFDAKLSEEESEAVHFYLTGDDGEFPDQSFLEISDLVGDTITKSFIIKTYKRTVSSGTPPVTTIQSRYEKVDVVNGIIINVSIINQNSIPTSF